MITCLTVEVERGFIWRWNEKASLTQSLKCAANNHRAGEPKEKETGHEEAV
jgi:hypothetical protein